MSALAAASDTRLMHGPYSLSDVYEREGSNGLKVVSTFSGGGGSSMGWKLAGFDVIGGVEIDPQMADIYEKNLKPKRLWRMPVGEFDEYVDIDVLDGSPPCSSFSMAGSREKHWGKAKKFREGQATQILDSLFVDYLKLAKRLQPKVMVAENVMGMVAGKAKGYAIEVLKEMDAMGYDAQLFRLNSAYMGVPQRRQRVFFIGRRKDLKLPKLALNYHETPITCDEAFAGLPPAGDETAWYIKKTSKGYGCWKRSRRGKSFADGHERGSMFNWIKLAPTLPAATQTATLPLFHWEYPRGLTATECARVQTFPDDYDFGGLKPNYVCGMSVPPFMMQRIALKIEKLLLSS